MYFKLCFQLYLKSISCAGIQSPFFPSTWGRCEWSVVCSSFRFLYKGGSLQWGSSSTWEAFKSETPRNEAEHSWCYKEDEMFEVEASTFSDEVS